MANMISAFPTFHFYVKGQKVDEMKGADPRRLEQIVLKHKVSNYFILSYLHTFNITPPPTHTHTPLTM